MIAHTHYICTYLQLQSVGLLTQSINLFPENIR
jgi:hypothetical protein